MARDLLSALAMALMFFRALYMPRIVPWATSSICDLLRFTMLGYYDAQKEPKPRVSSSSLCIHHRVPNTLRCECSPIALWDSNVQLSSLTERQRTPNTTSMVGSQPGSSRAAQLRTWAACPLQIDA